MCNVEQIADCGDILSLGRALFIPEKKGRILIMICIQKRIRKRDNYFVFVSYNLNSFFLTETLQTNKKISRA